MKSGFVLLILLIIFTFICAENVELFWNEPVVTCGREYSWLQENHEAYEDSYSIEEYDFVLSSKSMFKNSIKKYFSSKDDSAFLKYQSMKYNANFSFSLLAGVDVFVNNEKPSFFQYYGFDTNGRLGNNLYFYSQMWTGHYNRPVPRFSDSGILIDSWTKTPDNNTYLDNARARLLYRNDFLNIAFGRGKYEIGSNIGGSIILDDNCNEYGYFNIDLKFGDFRFSTMNASLTADSTVTVNESGFSSFDYNLDKFLTVHKVDWNYNDLHIFLGESVIYGARSTDLSYLMPVSLIRIVEHNLGDQDNVLIFAGTDYKWKDHYIYANLILDELRKAEIFSNWWGNKYAIQIGNAFYPKSAFISRIALEATIVRPWLYTHNTMLTKYSHDLCSLGFSEGSNLFQVAAKADFVLSKRVQLNVYGSFIRQGETGSYWNTNYNSVIDDIDNYETALFAGNPQNRYRTEIQANWQILAHHKLKLTLFKEFKEDDENDHGIYLSWFTKY